MQLLQLGLDAGRALGLLESAADSRLDRMDARLQALVEAPFQEGWSRLRQSTAASHDVRRRLLAEATGKFTDVLARDADPGLHVLANVGLALAWSNLNEAPLAKGAAREAVRVQQGIVQELSGQSAKHGRAATNPAGWGLAGAGAAGAGAAGAAGIGALAVGALAAPLLPFAVIGVGRRLYKKAQENKAEEVRAALSDEQELLVAVRQIEALLP